MVLLLVFMQLTRDLFAIAKFLLTVSDDRDLNAVNSLTLQLNHIFVGLRQQIYGLVEMSNT